MRCIYCISKNLWIQKCHHECSLSVNLVIDNSLYVAADNLPPVSVSFVVIMLLDTISGIRKGIDTPIYKPINPRAIAPQRQSSELYDHDG